MQNGRDHRIDFFRGIALIFIFWDHIPGNLLGHLTVRNVGLSDAAEIFVFLAGYASVLAYGKLLRRDGYWIACMRILRRAWVLYVAHIFLLAVLMGIVFTTNSHIETRDFVEEMGLGYFLANPQQALVDELLLRFKPSLMDPLPLYIVLLAALPLILPGLLRRPEYPVGLSLALYLLAPLFGWNFSSQPNGQWFFNPLAWQVLFVLGGAAAVQAQRKASTPAPLPARSLRQQPLFLAAATYLVLCAALALSWRWPALHDALMPQWLAERIYPIDKTNLSPLRLLHFLALAYCVAVVLPTGAWLERWPARQLCRMGSYSLEVFCLGVLLAPLTDAAVTLLGNGLVVQVAGGLAGVALMAALAAWLELNKRLAASRKSAPVMAQAKPA
ncbi:OpgC domain-containing protein [Pseudomonas indica]|uniref:OpgC protein n=1 Tax=Pseudomonas indica TaxID=137658 RepID=A0A1G8YIG9_9PSED|nr:OpgC domain-containing protein [Pseudomonas indica]SDK02447.1 hypothetical protein SAMN05216186_10410 [Pseudomonas indica]